ncbi:DNA polymerase III subunit beta [Kitasatospora sp. NPDC051853]|uniref:DNA polymerase III subunit beta n=1 Tax=Kitasatospora sp. NPDC051853 TaxID=3364058 RepID=UPI00378C1E1F
MKLRVSVQSLADAVAHTARALPARPPVPVMAGILLTTSEQGLRLAASDYDVYASDTVSAEVIEDGQVLVSGRLLAEITARLPKGTDVELTADGSRLRVVCRWSKYALPLLPVDEYPAFPPIPLAVATVQADAWSEAVSQVAFAASADETLPALTGVQILMDGDQVTLAATNRYRIARRTLTVQPAPAGSPAKGRKKTAAPAGEPVRALIPAKTMTDVVRSFDGDRPLTLHTDGDRWGWSYCGAEFITRLLGAEFPNIAHGLPATTGAISAPAAALADAIRRVALVATNNTPIRLTLAAAGQLLIEAGTGDDAQGSELVEVTAASLEEGYSIAFNPAFLGDGIKATGASEVTLHVGENVKPALLVARTGADDQDVADLPYRYVVMPVRLSK